MTPSSDTFSLTTIFPILLSSRWHLPGRPPPAGAAGCRQDFPAITIDIIDIDVQNGAAMSAADSFTRSSADGSDMHPPASSMAEVIRALRPKTDAKVVQPHSPW